MDATLDAATLYRSADANSKAALARNPAEVVIIPYPKLSLNAGLLKDALLHGLGLQNHYLLSPGAAEALRGHSLFLAQVAPSQELGERVRTSFSAPGLTPRWFVTGRKAEAWTGLKK
jgi:hypothetical protein